MSTGRILSSFQKDDRSRLEASWGGSTAIGVSPADLSGVVSVSGTPSRRPVTLYDLTSGAFVRQLWSDSSGNYVFKGVASWRRYMVVASDFPTYTYPDKAVSQTPGVWTIDINLDGSVGTLTVSTGEAGYSGWDNVGDSMLLRASAMQANSNFGGPGAIMGRVLLSGYPVRRPVSLCEQKTGSKVSEVWSDSNGCFAFPGLSTSKRYLVLARDFPTYSQDAALASNVLAESASVALYPSTRSLQQGLVKADSQHLRSIWGGGANPGVISGTVKIGSTPSRRKVRLYDHGSGFFIQEVWCNADGSYLFKGISKSFKYTVTATDYPSYTYNDVVACNLTPV